MIDISDEYGSLRSEMFQLFKEQSQLAFATGLGSAAVLFGLLETIVPVGVGVAVWLLVLTGIARKLVGNYNRLYRIGTYIKVVHEQKGDPLHIPRIDEPAWMLRSRSIGTAGREFWRWASGSQIDAGFIRLLGVGSLLFVVLHLIGATNRSPQHFISASVSLLVFLLLVRETQSLAKTKNICDLFEQELLTRYGKGELADTKSFGLLSRVEQSPQAYPKGRADTPSRSA